MRKLLIMWLCLMVWPSLMYAQGSYTLSDADVVVENGIITSCNYDFSIKDIIIPDQLDGQTVTGIDDHSFGAGVFMNKGITSVVLPATLEMIGSLSFLSNSISSIVIPDNVKRIGEESFCSNLLVALIIPSSVGSIEGSAFLSNKLTSVTLSTGVNEIGVNAFASNPDLTQVLLPTPTASNFTGWIDSEGDAYTGGNAIIDFSRWYAAQYTYTLTDDDVVVENGSIVSCSYDFSANVITIPETLDGQTIIGISMGENNRGMFENKGITGVNLPSTLVNISRRAFHSNKITSLVIPESMIVVESEAFKSNNINTLTLNGGKEIGYSCFGYNKLTSVDIPASIVTIDGNAFEYNQLTSVTIASESKLAYLGYGAFGANTGLSQVILPHETNASFLYWQDNDGNKYTGGEVVTDLQLEYTAHFAYTLLDEDVVVENGVIQSCSYDFAKKHIIIPDILDEQTITAIADKSWNEGVFAEKGIISIKLPDQLQEIGHYAFKANQLVVIDFPETLKRIGNYAFADNKIVSLDFPRYLEEIENNAFSIKELTNVTLPDHLKVLGGYAFYHSQNETLNGIVLPNSGYVNFLGWVDSNGKSYVGGDTYTDFTVQVNALLNYTLTDDDVVVENGIIKSCSYDYSANAITIPAVLDGQNVVEIADAYDINGDGNWKGVFEGKGIFNVELPPTLKTIGNSAFEDNFILNLTLPSATTIKHNAFESNRLTEINIPASVVLIYNWAFGQNNLTNVTFEPDSRLEEIQNGAFSRNNDLTSFILPTVAPEIGKYLFWMDEEGTQYEAGDAVTYADNGYKVHVEYTLSEADVEVNQGVITSCSLKRNFGLHLTIPDVLDGHTITKIANDNTYWGVFAHKNIYTIQLPNKLDTIGKQTFYGNYLRKVSTPQSLKVINASAFEYNRIAEVVFPENSQITVIAEKAFSSNVDLIQINLVDHKAENFMGWIDTQGNQYTGGSNVTLFDRGYRAQYSYTLTDNDVEVIDGVIESSDFSSHYNYIIIPEELDGQTVVGIGNRNVFSEKGLTGVQLPPFLKEIGSYAFDKNNLTSIQIPENVTRIGGQAFYNNNISEVDLVNVESIEYSAFSNNKLKRIEIPKSAKAVGAYAFSSNNLSSVVIASNSQLIRIGRYAFGYNDDLSYLKLPTPELTSGIFTNWQDDSDKFFDAGSNVSDFETGYVARVSYTLTDEDVEVVDGMINSCSYQGATILTIPEYLDGQSVTGIVNAEFNSEGVFDNKGLIEVKLPESLVHIGRGAFKSNDIRDLIIPEGVARIQDEAFYANRLKNVTLPGSLQLIGRVAFASNYQLKEITLPVLPGVETGGWYDSDGNEYNGGDQVTDFYQEYISNVNYTLKDEDVEVENGVIISCSYYLKAKSIIIPERLDGQNVIDIKYGFNDRGFTKITLPASLKQISANAFSGNELTEISIPASVTSISNNAFSGNKLEKVTIAENSKLLFIGGGAFGSDEKASSFLLPAVTHPDFIGWIDSFGNEAKEGDLVSTSDRCYAAQITYTLTDDDVVVNDGVIDTCSYDFEANVITIPAKLDGQFIRRISYVNFTTANGVNLNEVQGVFENKGLVKVVLPDSLETIGYNSFRGNDIIILEIPDSVKVIQSRAFIDNQLTQLEFPQCLKTIGEDSFARNSLKRVILPDSLQCIERFAFMNNDIAELILPDGLKEIESRAFYGNQLTHITIPGSVSRIGESAFSENQLLSVLFEQGKALEFIENDAFANNKGLAHIQLLELKDQRFTGWVDDLNNEYLGGQLVDDLSRQYKALFKYTLTDEDVDVVNGTLVRCSWMGRANVIVIPDVLDDQTIVGIGQEVFRSKSLIQVQLPNTLEFIEKYAFQGNKLQQVNLPQSIKRIGRRAFYWNVLKEVVLPVGLDTIGDYSFGENRLEQISLPQSLKYLGNGSFSDNNLIEVTIPESISHIQSSCFSENNLTRVNFLGLVERIDDNAFYENNLEEVILPQSIQYIGNGAFRYNRINSLDLTGNKYLTFLGERAFSDNIGGWKFVLPQSSDPNFAGWADNRGNIYKAGDEVISLDYSYSCMVNGISMRLAGDLDYPDVLVNDKNYKQIKVINSGNEPLNINAVKVPDGFESDWNGGVINVGDYHSFYVIFKPLKYEAYSGQLVLTVEGSDVSSSMDITALGIGSAISIPDALDFGKVAIDSTLTKEIRIYNIGNRVLTIDSLRLPKEFSVNWTKGSVSAGESRLIAVSFTPETESVYEVNMAVEGNQRNTDSHYYYTIKGEGVLRTGFEEEFIKNLRLYPNPAKDHILLEVDDPSKIEQLEICDLSGRKLYQTDQFSYSTKLQLGNYRTGVYLLIIRNKDGDSLVRKFIKK